MDFLGYPVLTEPPNRRDVMRTAYVRTLTRLDTPGGRFTDDDRTLGAREQFEVVWTALDRPAAHDMLTFLAARAGRLKPFWLPSWRPDLTLAADYLDPGDRLDVTYIQAARLTGSTALDARRQHLVLIRPHETILRPFSWSTIVDNEDGTESLTLTSVPGVTVLAVSEYMLCWLQLVRLDTDTPIVRWFNHDLAEISLPVVTVPRETPSP